MQSLADLIWPNDITFPLISLFYNYFLWLVLDKFKRIFFFFDIFKLLDWNLGWLWFWNWFYIEVFLQALLIVLELCVLPFDLSHFLCQIISSFSISTFCWFGCRNAYIVEGCIHFKRTSISIFSVFEGFQQSLVSFRLNRNSYINSKIPK